MGIMLPGALELPHDDIFFKLDALEKKNASQAGEIAKLTGKNTALTDEIEKLKARIAELEASK